MKYIKLVIALLIIPVIWLVILTVNHTKCKLNDSEALAISRLFLNNMNVEFPRAKGFVERDNVKLSNQYHIKKVVFKTVGDTSIVTRVDCDNKQVIMFENEELITTTHQYIEKSKTPKFIEENAATEILLSLGKRLRLPQQVQFAGIQLNRQAGLWTGTWKRKHNNIFFDDESLAITITAASGQFCGFNNQVNSKAPINEVKVSKLEAIETARNALVNFLSKEKWEQNKEIFAVKKAELKIITHKSIFDRVLSLDSPPRFVWVVVFDSEEGMDRLSRGILIEDESVIQIDAETRKIIEQKFNIVP